MSGVSDRDQTEFNSAFSYIGRLSTLFYLADESAIKLDAHSWFQVLLAIRRELSTHMKEHEVAHFNEIKVKINRMINKNNMQNRKRGKSDIYSELHDELENFEQELRRIYRESGLEMKMRDDPAFALGA
jgi:hypothetical protein